MTAEDLSTSAKDSLLIIAKRTQTPRVTTPTRSAGPRVEYERFYLLNVSLHHVIKATGEGGGGCTRLLTVVLELNSEGGTRTNISLCHCSTRPGEAQ